MRGRLTCSVALLLVLPLFAGVIGPVEQYQVRVSLRGFDDDVPRFPAAGVRGVAGVQAPLLPSASGACVVTGCEVLVPRLQYHWFDLLLRDLDGEPVRGAEIVATFTGFEGGLDEVRFRTDANGVASILRRNAVDPVLEVRLVLPDNSQAAYVWAVDGDTAGATAPLVIRREGGLVEARVEVLKKAHLWIDQHAVVRNGSLAPANALVSDIAVLRDGQRLFGAAAYGAFSDPRDVQLGVTAVGLEESADLGLPVDVLAQPDSATIDARGILGPELSFVATVGSIGDGADSFLRIFGAPGTYRVTLRELGPLLVAQPSFTGVRATALDHGLLVGDAAATLSVDAVGLVMTDAHVPLLGTTSVVFARDAAVRTTSLSSLSDLTPAGAHFIDEGDCTGAWRVDMRGYIGIAEPSLTIAHAPGYAVPTWARESFPESGLCS